MTNPTPASIPAPTVPTVKAWLQNQCLLNLVPETGYRLSVCLDDPGPEQADDMVIIGNVPSRKTSPTQMIGNLGAGAVFEEYEMRIIVSVYRGGPDQLAPFNRAWSIAGAVESVIRSDPTFGGAVIVGKPSRSQDGSQWDADHKGRVVEVEIMISVTAQI